MSIKPEIAEIQEEMTAWRRDLHQHPETAYEEHRTSEFVARKLDEFGIEVHRGLAGTGVVGTLRWDNGPKSIGLRADMDALDLDEANTFAHRSVNKGKMHACGHDGHTTMLLGAAKYLAARKQNGNHGLNGTTYFIFQPAEENRAGARVMINEGLFRLFPAQSVFGMHNMPGIPAGQIALHEGPVMASADGFHITVKGDGGHGAFPHKAIDPILIAAEIVLALQRIVSRSVDPLDQAVVSVTRFNSGTADNIIPEKAVLHGTARAFRTEVQDLIESSIRQVVAGVTAAHGATGEVVYERQYAPTINTRDETEIANQAARDIVGAENVRRDLPPVMGAEDFGFMLQEKPGCYVWIGNGTDSEGGCIIHNPNYDFNDRILATGASYWARLVENELGHGN